jgi:spore coat polysaccharide biosynthesis predicted glycosyltransferase SpsG
MSHVFFRVDADTKIGTGHVARCRCLARELVKKGIPSSFLMAGGKSPITESLEREGFQAFTLPEGECDEADALTAFISSSGADRPILVVDSPRSSFYGGDFQEGIRKRGVGLLMIAFRSEGHFNADALHNQNLLALEEVYSVEPYTRLLLGPRYVILDERFRRLRDSRGDLPAAVADRLFLFFGGADVSNMTLKALRSLAAMEQPLRRVITVVGPLHGRLDEISAFARANPALPVDLHINTPEMPRLMTEADIAVTSGGLTIWELACLGVPNVVISTSERERIHTPLMEKRGGCIYLGHEDEVAEQSIRAAVSGLMANGKKRHEMARAGLELVDGRGTERVIAEMLKLISDAPTNERKGSRP